MFINRETRCRDVVASLFPRSQLTLHPLRSTPWPTVLATPPPPGRFLGECCAENSTLLLALLLAWLCMCFRVIWVLSYGTGDEGELFTVGCSWIVGLHL